jgi:hypothetical protein
LVGTIGGLVLDTIIGAGITAGIMVGIIGVGTMVGIIGVGIMVGIMVGVETVGTMAGIMVGIMDGVDLIMAGIMADFMEVETIINTVQEVL